MTSGLDEQNFCTYDEAKKWAAWWIGSQDEPYCRHRIHMLPERWEQEWLAIDYTLNNIFYQFLAIKLLALTKHPQN